MLPCEEALRARHMYCKSGVTVWLSALLSSSCCRNLSQRAVNGLLKKSDQVHAGSRHTQELTVFAGWLRSNGLEG